MLCRGALWCVVVWRGVSCCAVVARGGVLRCGVAWRGATRFVAAKYVVLRCVAWRRAAVRDVRTHAPTNIANLACCGAKRCGGSLRARRCGRRVVMTYGALIRGVHTYVATLCVMLWRGAKQRDVMCGVM